MDIMEMKNNKLIVVLGLHRGGTSAMTRSFRQISKTFDAKRGTKRLDVVKGFYSPGAELSGFDLVAPANSLVPENYEILILQDLPNTTWPCTGGKPLQVK